MILHNPLQPPPYTTTHYQQHTLQNATYTYKEHCDRHGDRHIHINHFASRELGTEVCGAEGEEAN